MRRDALDQCRGRLAKAASAVARLKAAASFDEAEDAWTDFLIAAATIYSKLEQGAKSSGVSTAWYGRKKHLRRTDPLLRYLHHARNVDEHGIERVVSRYNHTGPIWGETPKFGQRIPVHIQALDDQTKQPVGEKVPGFYSGGTIKLIQVNNRRHGEVCDPPKHHLGNQIAFHHEPLDVAELALTYLTSLLDEAGQLAVV